MKKLILLCALCTSVGNIFAQKETFDLTTYTPPKEWKKQTTENGILFSKEDAAKQKPVGNTAGERLVGRV